MKINSVFFFFSMLDAGDVTEKQRICISSKNDKKKNSKKHSLIMKTKTSHLKELHALGTVTKHHSETLEMVFTEMRERFKSTGIL